MVWDQVIEQLFQAFTPYMLLICLAGTTLGILWGATC